MLGKMVTRKLIRKLDDLLDYASFDHAHFGGIGKGSDQLTEMIKKETELYRKTWIIPLLIEVKQALIVSIKTKEQ